MLSEKMKALGTKKSVIREIFEYAKIRKAEIGDDNVFDFSLGNPSVPSPDIVNQTLISLLQEKDAVALHGYTSAQGDLQVRKSIAAYIEKEYHAKASPDLIYLTSGAAAALTISLHAVMADDRKNEVIVFAPYFPEYKVFAEKAGATLVTVPPTEPDFMPDFAAFQNAITENTRAVIVNSPNNPTGAVLSETAIKKMAHILEDAEKKCGHPIYLIADEPYRELVYGNIEVPYLPNFYQNTIVCYSFSKALSLPGERIGYILVSPQAEDAKNLYAAVMGAGRALGFVCAPSLFQYMIPACLGKTSDIGVYETNRNLLYQGLTDCGFTCVPPGGAFYLFMQSPEKDAYAFCEKAKEYELLLVPSDDFGYPGYVRIAYCVTTKQIENALPAFRKLAKAYHLK